MQEQDAENLQTWETENRDIVIQPSEDNEIDEAFSDMPQSESCIELYRIKTEQGGRPAFIEEMTPVMFKMAYVKENYGGGRYQARAKYSDGRKKKLFFDIEGPRVDLSRQIINPNTGEAVADHARAGRIPVTRFESPMTPGYESRLNLPATRDELASLVKMLVQEVVAGAQVKTESRADFYKELAIMREIFQQPQQPQAPMEQLINMFSRGVEMASNGSAEGPSFWLTAIKEMKEPIMQLMGTVQTAIIASKGKTIPAPGGPTSPEQPGVAPGGGPTSAAPEQPAQPTGDDAMILQALKMFMPALINGASKNTDVDLYVDFILDQVPEGMYPKLLDWLQKPDCLDTLAAVEPGIRFQREWWVSLRQALIGALTESTNDDRGVQSSQDTDPSTGLEGNS